MQPVQMMAVAAKRIQKIALGPTGVVFAGDRPAAGVVFLKVMIVRGTDVWFWI